MKKFEFRLQTVLEQRERHENLARKALAEALAELVKMQEIVRKLVLERKNLEQEFEEKLKQEPAKLPAYLDYFASLGKRIADQQDAILKFQNIVEQKRQALAEARKEKKVIENLKDKQYSEWKKELEKQETAFLDELATSRYRNLMNNEG